MRRRRSKELLVVDIRMTPLDLGRLMPNVETVDNDEGR